MRNLLSLAVCTIYEWDQTGDIISTMLRVGPETWSSEDVAGQAYSLAEFPFAQRVLAEQLPQQITVDHAANDSAVLAYMQPQEFKTLLMLPMVYQQRVVGLLEAVDVDAAVTFTKHQIALGQLLANQAASAIENARLYTASQRSLAQQSAFREAGAIISSTLNLDSVLRIIAEQMGQVIDATSAYICSFDGETRLETVLAEYIGPSACPQEMESDLGSEYIENDDKFVESLELNQPSYSHIDDPDCNPSVRKHMQQYGVKSILYVPFQIKNQPIGFAKLWDSRQKREFTAEEVVLCRALADQAAIAIEKARLFEQAQTEILERKRAEEQIKMSLKEKEVLLQEIHHRVKNNMQVISSLLNLQSGYVQDQQILEILQDSQNRVRSMALIHEKLYRSENLAQIDFGEYVRDLTADLVRSSGAQSEKVALEVRVDNVFLDIDTAVPCGLILNELVSNSLKHAFPKNLTGDLLVELRAGPEGMLQLNVVDNGIGFPQELDYHQLDSLGLQLVTSLVEQLDGTIALDPAEGTNFQIKFRRSNLSGNSQAN
jgi:two-component sensor histidine kinase